MCVCVCVCVYVYIYIYIFFFFYQKLHDFYLDTLSPLSTLDNLRHFFIDIAFKHISLGTRMLSTLFIVNLCNVYGHIVIQKVLF